MKFERKSRGLNTLGGRLSASQLSTRVVSILGSKKYMLIITEINRIKFLKSLSASNLCWLVYWMLQFASILTI